MAAPTHTIASLRLDLEAARAGRTWLLLPEGFRDQACGNTYPLPSATGELQILTTITIPFHKKDCGCIYLRRAIQAFRRRASFSRDTVCDIERRLHEVTLAHSKYTATVKQLGQQAKEAAASVQTHAEQAIASLDYLFALGRRGISGQMEAHLAEREWQGEKISASAFRACFKMVAQTVKALGLPTEQRSAAGKAVVDELAASLAATKDALSQAPMQAAEPEKEVEH